MPIIIEWQQNCSGDRESTSLQTPAGQLLITSQKGVILATDWVLGADKNPSSEHELDCYWQHPDKNFTVKLLNQGSDYRHKVWAALCQIPFGETLSYLALAKKMGSSARAVGNACRDNPYAIFIPCHRVVSVSGMGGYCGQTEGELLAIKRRLLEFEASHRK